MPELFRHGALPTAFPGDRLGPGVHSGRRTRTSRAASGFSTVPGGIMNGRWRRFSSVVRVGIPAPAAGRRGLGCTEENGGPTLTPQVSGTAERLQAVSPVNDRGGLGERHRRNLRADDRRGSDLGLGAGSGGGDAAVPRRRGGQRRCGLSHGGRHRDGFAHLQDGGWRRDLDAADP